MIVVTGARENVGRELVARLAVGGEQVRALSRNAEHSGLRNPVAVFEGDLSNATSLAGLCASAKAAFLVTHIPGDGAEAHRHEFH